tara:strand:- start:1309 stop:2991 length:1683 start_codon:yes stop_codon:yes gene_type:complete
MFENFFSDAKQYTYDAANTLSRASSMLLQRGVLVQVGQSACTNGKDTIWLPQAMRKWLGWDEIDLVRYLLHHENAHILHSGDRGRWPYPICADIENCLEDIRIEAIESSSHAGSGGIFHRGKKIMDDIWAGVIGDMKKDGCPLPTAVVHAIYACNNNPEWLDRKTGVTLIDSVVELFKSGATRLPEDDPAHDARPIHDRCADLELLNDPIRFKHLVHDIAQLLVQSADAIDQEDPKAIKKGNGDVNDSSLSADTMVYQTGVDYSELEQGDCKFGGGMIERAVEHAVCGTPQDGCETITQADVDKGGNGMLLGNFDYDCSDRICRKAEEHWNWGRWACGVATPLINLLRGQSKSAWSHPKDSGVRIAQRRVPAFLRGVSNQVLRRRRDTKFIGTSVVMMVDDSGSMSPDDQLGAWRSAALLGHACERAGLRCMIARYSNTVFVEKFFHTPMAAVRLRLGACVHGGTNAIDALDVAKAHLEGERTDRKVVFFICDGMTEDCRGIIRELKLGGAEVYPLMIGYDGCRAAEKGRFWDLPETSRILDPRANLASTVVDRLCSVIR